MPPITSSLRSLFQSIGTERSVCRSLIVTSSDWVGDSTRRIRFLPAGRTESCTFENVTGFALGWFHSGTIVFTNFRSGCPTVPGGPATSSCECCQARVGFNTLSNPITCARATRAFSSSICLSAPMNKPIACLSCNTPCSCSVRRLLRAPSNCSSFICSLIRASRAVILSGNASTMTSRCSIESLRAQRRRMFFGLASTAVSSI